MSRPLYDYTQSCIPNKCGCDDHQADPDGSAFLMPESESEDDAESENL